MNTSYCLLERYNNDELCITIYSYSIISQLQFVDYVIYHLYDI